MRVKIVIAATGMACACAPNTRSDDAPDVAAIVSNLAVVDLISPAKCQLQLGKLKNCVIAPLVHNEPPMDTAVPLRTVVRRQMSGNCSSQFPLAISITLDSAEGAHFPFLSQSQLVLRPPGNGVVRKVEVADASPWTPTAAFADTCRISLDIQPNEVDVDTAAQAGALLAAIDQEIADAERDVRNYETLLALQAAFTFTQAVAASFHQELTNETVQVLRQAALDAAPAMQIAALGCGDALSPEQRQALFELLTSMVALGDPSAWENPDGSPKTLEQFYGPGAAEVLARLEEIASQANPDLETQFRQGLQAATAERVRLQQKRALASLQLEPWLGDAP